MNEENLFNDFGQYVNGLNLPDEPGVNQDPDDLPLYQPDDEPHPEPDPEPEPAQLDFITELLKRNGLDRHAIKLQNEDGEVEEVDFDNLSDEEKLAIYDFASNPAVSDEEINAIQYLRNNKMTLQQLVEWQRNEAVKDYLAQSQSQTYNVDSLSDDELYLFDLHDRFPDMTDEEMQQELETAKSNEALFNKKITALRTDLKAQEDEHTKRVEQEEAEQREQQFQEFAQDLVNSARDISELHNLVLEDEDKEAILSFLLDRDASGQSEFYKRLNNPKELFKLAWYALKGEEAFNSVNDYYKGIIEQTRRLSASAGRATRKNVTAPPADNAFDLESQYKNI